VKKGLVLGKFMPLHTGHLALIDFAAGQCEELFILLCYTNNEPVSGSIREEWLKTATTNHSNCSVVKFLYNEAVLPNTSVSSKEVSQLWSRAINTILPDIDVIFSSELYGDYVASFLGIRHIVFDIERKAQPISASAILTNPLLNWNFIDVAARPYFVKKIVLLGTESTGKSTLTEKLATYFNAAYVPEMAREILEKTEDCKPEHLVQIAALHATTILSKLKEANRLLFIDTDINITRSYSKYLFNETLHTEHWIEDANKADLYIFLEPDCEFVQDGTRLPDEERHKLSLFHKEQLKQAGIPYFSINGNWEERMEKSCALVKKTFKI
jgi:HTH-type transcriptional repressor of NAD biosynthesis genes